MRQRSTELCDLALSELGARPIEVHAEIERTTRFLERGLARCAREVSGRLPICASDQRAALLLPGHVTAGAAVDIALLLTAGNCVVARMTSRATRLAAVIEELFDEAVPGAVVLERSASGAEFLERIVADDSIPFAMVFGGERVGDDLLTRACTHTSASTRILYEGPGTDPVIVLNGAPLDRTLRAVVAAKFASGGQTRAAAENIIVHRSLHDELVVRLVAACEAAVVGDPADPSTTIAQVASSKVPAIVREQLADAQCRCARIVCGGAIDGRSIYPTVSPAYHRRRPCSRTRRSRRCSP